MRLVFLLFLTLLAPIAVSSDPILVSAESVQSWDKSWQYFSEDFPNGRDIQVAKGLSLQGINPPIKGEYRNQFYYIKTGKPLGIYLDRIQEVDQVFVNGHRIGGTGEENEKGEYKPNWYYKRLYFISESFLYSDRANEIVIQVIYKNKTFQGGLFRSVPKIGNFLELEFLILKEDGRDYSFIMLFFGIGAYQVFSLFLRRQTKSNLFLLLSTLFFVLWRIPLLNISYSFFALPFDYLLRIFFAAQTMLPASIMLFNYSIFKIPVRTKETILLFSLCLIGMIQVTSIEMEYRITLLRIWEFLLLFVLYFVAKTVIQKAKEKQVEAYLVGVGFLVLCIGAFIDIGIDLTTGKNIYLSQYGFLSLMILSAVSISYKNSKNEKELSLLTKNLEDRVKERTTELEQKNLDLETDLVFASQLQGHLLPKFSPKISGFQIQATYLPMKQVGGDMYDWVELDSSKMLLILADVAGHGVPAAFVSSMVKVQFRESAKIHSSPDLVLQNMNLALIDLVSKYYVTAVCALIDMESREILISSAGHPNPILQNIKSQELITPKVRGPILGWRPDFGFQVWKRKIETKDRFFFYTDGVTEARGNFGMYGEQKLIEVLKKNIGNNLQNTSQDILIEITKFSEEEIKDDVTFLILEFD